MNSTKRLVLDANIILRAVLGTRVRHLLRNYANVVEFYTPDICMEEARRNLSSVSKTRRLDLATGLLTLDRFEHTIEVLDRHLYEPHEGQSRARLASRDVDDWPIMASCLLLNCPVWTEDQDFFGSGIATWTTQNIELFLRDT